MLSGIEADKIRYQDNFGNIFCITPEKHVALSKWGLIKEGIGSEARALDKREYLVIIRDYFC